jgi:hypothetical protein
VNRGVSSLGPIARRLSAGTKLALMVLTAVGYHAEIGPYHQMAQIYVRMVAASTHRTRREPGRAWCGARPGLIAPTNPRALGPKRAKGGTC